MSETLICQLVIMLCGQVSFVLLIYQVSVLEKLLVQNSKDVPLLDLMVKIKFATCFTYSYIVNNPKLGILIMQY